MHIDEENIKNIIKQAKVEKRTSLTEIESKGILKHSGIDITEPFISRCRNDAVSISISLGFPVVLKVVSPDIVHKSDTGGVALSINTPEQVYQAYDRIIDTVKRRHQRADIEGISVQRQAEAGTEIIIGVTKDPQFGPAIMFGIGGIWVELLNDVCFRIVPITNQDAAEMIREVKGYRLLEGYRGRKTVDIPIIEKWLIQVSHLTEEIEEIKELDINPIYVYQKGAIAVDARIILE